MNKKKKPDINELKMGKNPFMTNIEIKCRVFDKDEHVIIKSEESINIPVGSFKNQMVVEEQSYTKLWHDVDFRNIVLKLSTNAIKLFVFIQYQLSPNKDYIWINNRLFQDSADIRMKSQYEEGVEELVRYGIITTTIYKDVYWINPLILFSGNRLKKYPDNLKMRD
jgi:hypothetical protein